MKETNTYKKLLNNPTNNHPVQLIVHHSGGTDANPLADTSEHTAKGMELWHLGKGWDGLGYHYVIHKNGEIWKGRPEHINGAHARGHNSNSIGICLSGNFDATLPTKAQEESLKGLLQDLSRRFNIDPSKVIPHRNVANKTCYGNKLSERWARDILLSSDSPVEQPQPVDDTRIDDLTRDIENLKKEFAQIKKNQGSLIRFIIQLIRKK